MHFIQNVWWLLVLIGIMILIHELGHYWAARFFDVKVEAFSFGFGPRLFGFRRGETDFRFSAIPFGGYVKMAGEQPGEDNTNDPRSFTAKARWQRLIIAFAGPAMNIVLAIGLLAGLFMFHYPRPANAGGPAVVGYVEKGSAAETAGVREGDRIVQVQDVHDPDWEEVTLKEIAAANSSLSVVLQRNGERIPVIVKPILHEQKGIGYAGWDDQHEVQLGSILKGSGADKAGLRRDDIIVGVNGRRVYSTARLHELVGASAGAPLTVEYRRGNALQKADVQPAWNEADKRWMIGVELRRPIVFTRLSLPDALRESVRQNIRGAALIYQFLQGIVERRMSPKSLEGPIRIAQLSGEAAREGAISYIGLMAMVSLNLAIFNLLPIPILDGGLILLLLVEMIMRRDLSMQFKEAVFKVGMVFLMAVVVFVLYNDISKILPG